MTCSDLCTAAKCQELEERIGALEQALELLEASFEAHTSQDIPEAHRFAPLENDTEPEPQAPTSVIVSANFISSSVIDIRVEVDGVSGSDTVELPELEPLEPEPPESENNAVTVNVSQTGDTEYTIQVIVGDESDSDILYLPVGDETEDNLPDENDIGDVSVSANYSDEYLTITVSHGDSSDEAVVYIDVETTIRRVVNNDYITEVNNYNTGDNTGGNDDVACQQLSQDLQIALSEILAAIAGVSTQVSNVQEYVTIDIEGTTATDFVCIENQSSDSENDNAEAIIPYVETEYKGKGLIGLHELAKTINYNLVSIFEETCGSGGILAVPSWWQVRLGAGVPQLVCTFRKSGSRTYHSLSIPHPINTEPATEEVLPAYTKGNWQGMVVCKDNSKFIVNCVTKAEAERMCGIAAQLIDNEYLELPPRIYVGERKGQAVGVDTMIPATVMYYSTGQQNLVPNWRVRLADI